MSVPPVLQEVARVSRARRMRLSRPTTTEGDWLSPVALDHSNQSSPITSSSRRRRDCCTRPDDASNASTNHPCTWQSHRLGCCLPLLPSQRLRWTRQRRPSSAFCWAWVWKPELPAPEQPRQSRPRLHHALSTHRDHPSTSCHPCSSPSQPTEPWLPSAPWPPPPPWQHHHDRSMPRGPMSRLSCRPYRS